MPKVYYSSDDTQAIEYQISSEESLLDGLLGNGIEIPYGCKGGVCQSCIMQSDGDIPVAAQQGLKAAQIDKGYFLSCQCFPQDGFAARPSGIKRNQQSVKVVAKELLNDNVIRLRLENQQPYSAGQFMTLFKDDEVSRSYSLASLPSDEFIEFHIKHIAQGKFSNWAMHELSVNDEIKIEGPAGDCYYTDIDPSKPLLLSGIGTGLAPLYGIVRDALAQGHTGAVHVFIGAKSADGFYLVEELEALESLHDNVHIHHVYMESSANAVNGRFVQGNLYESVKQALPDLAGFKVFLCGADSFVKKMKKQCFLSGASMRDIASDPFIPS